MDLKARKYTFVTAALGVLVLLVAVVILLTRGSGDPRGSQDGPIAEGASLINPAGAGGGLAAADRDGDGIVFQSGMHPWIVEDEPGRCPICGMDLVPVHIDDVESGIIRIDAATIQNTGVRTAEVSVESLRRIVRTTGRFETDQQRGVAVSSRVGGWIERLHVNYEGARVAKGQPLLEIYSPQLVSTQQEYLLALRNAERLNHASEALRIVDAARRRLSFWDISDDQIRRLDETRTPQKTLTLYAPASGTVVETSVIEGQQVTAGPTLMRISDLSRLWLMVDVYEQDLSWVGVGMHAEISLPYDPGVQITGRVEYLYDELDADTRTATARIQVPNPALKLKPGMYATVHLMGGEAAELPVVPSEAVIRTGDRAVVILALGEGRFFPAEVRVGVEAGDRTQILSGLQGGERVVTSAQFLIDSEARLSSAIGAMTDTHNHGATSAVLERPGSKAALPRRTDGIDAGALHDGHASKSSRGKSTPGKSAPEPSTSGTQKVLITIDSTGFHPIRVHLEEGKASQLTFIRHSETTCATAVQIPDLGIPATDLPMHEPITITVMPERARDFTFACAMDMLTGTVMVESSSTES